MRGSGYPPSPRALCILTDYILSNFAFNTAICSFFWILASDSPKTAVQIPSKTCSRQHFQPQHRPVSQMPTLYLKVVKQNVKFRCKGCQSQCEPFHF